MGEAAKLGRRSLELWNAHDLEGVYELWDDDIVVRPDRYFPDSEVLVGPEAARRFWEWQRDSMGFGRLELLEEIREYQFFIDREQGLDAAGLGGGEG